MIVKPIKTRIFQEGENLVAFIERYLKNISEQSIIVVTSKIIALSENRTAIAPDIKTKEKFIRSESEFAVKTKYVWLTIKDGTYMASAGIDESNANGKLIFLPKDSFKTANFLRKTLQDKYQVKKLGVLITDSRTIPLRAGVVGIALGYAGFSGLKDYRGKKDIFGRKFKFSRTDIADSLATAAVLVMGEGKEQQPLAIIEKAPIKFSNKMNRRELQIDIKEDMYRPLFSGLPKF
ncbi:MAG: coenzyme F420-0:L-glutamate ligase [Patescibacteria group bacterium]|nr:coenzyme F420-0:L-glutamate ligase [Patescibacteria group bacterium]MDD4610659.1 coenzyme F420-0:L-glutamate ligase [Patescibacteria group bacterium]